MRRLALGATVLVLAVSTVTSCADATSLQRQLAPDAREAAPRSGLSARWSERDVRSDAAMQPVNASFEDGESRSGCPRRWTCEVSGGASAHVATGVAKGGDRALKVAVPDSGDRFTLRSTAMPALPRRRYEAAVWRLSEGGRPQGGESVRLRFLDRSRRLIGSGIDRDLGPASRRWTGVAAKANSPAGTAYVEVEITVAGPRGTVWLDGVKVRERPILQVWGGTSVRRGPDADTLSIHVATPTPGGVHVGTIDAFGTYLTVAGPRTLVAPRGATMTYEVGGGARYEASTGTIRVSPGQAATIQVTGRFTPTPGTGYPIAKLGDPIAQVEYPIYVVAWNYRPRSKDNQSPDIAMLPARAAVRRSVDRLARYLESRKTSSGGWSIAHPYWPGQPREDPQAIAVLTQGFMKRAQASRGGAYEAQARRGLEWLVSHQRPDGSFGLPWAFGSSSGHFSTPAHYRSGTTHVAGEPLAVVTIAAGSALLDGFKAYGNTRYLAGAVRAMNYLLDGPNGFQWLDARHTRGSIPYCNLKPALPSTDPRVRAHHVLSAVKNTSVEIYNIDGAALSFLKALYVETGDERLLRYGDAIARNLASKVRPSGSIPYSWYERSPHSGGYAHIAFTGLLEYAQMRGQERWVAAALRGFSWMGNHARSDLVPTEGYASLSGLNLSADVTAYVTNALRKQRTDGSFSGGTATRYDAVMFAILSDLLLTMGG
ncbi:MAG TPA: prenyltransferase/squalene oxidase repeat-containing protein [Actinopolymorphaceae bacterium]